MKINQIYSLLNDINAQMFGEDALDVHDLSGIVSMGETVVGNTDNTDLFIGKLVDRIGRTVIRTLDLELDFPGLYMDSFEFGAILQKITVNPFEAIKSSEWEVGEKQGEIEELESKISRQKSTISELEGIISDYEDEISRLENYIQQLEWELNFC